MRSECMYSKEAPDLRTKGSDFFPKPSLRYAPIPIAITPASILHFNDYLLSGLVA